MKKTLLLIMPILFTGMLVFNISYLNILKYDLIYFNLFFIVTTFYILRTSNYFKTKTAVYIGMFNFYILGMLMTYSLSERYSNSDYRLHFLLSLIMFLLIYIVSYEFTPIKTTKLIHYKNLNFNSDFLYIGSLLGMFLPIILNLYMNISSYGSLQNALFTSYAIKEFNQSNYLLYLYHLIIPSLLIVIWYGKEFSKKNLNYILIRNSGVFLTFLVILLSKSRGNLVELIFSIVILIMILQWKDKGIRNSTKMKILVITFISFILIASVGLIRNFNIGNDNIVVNMESIEKNIVGSVDAMDIYYYILEEIPSKHEYLFGRSFVSTFISFIPRSLWEEKPVSFGNEIMIYKYGNIIPNYAVAPSYIGEWYANFGIFGIFLGALILGIITKCIDENQYTKKNILWIVFLIISMFYFWRLIRGDFQSATIPYIIKIVYLYLLYLFTKIRTKKIRNTG